MTFPCVALYLFVVYFFGVSLKPNFSLCGYIRITFSREFRNGVQLGVYFLI